MLKLNSPIETLIEFTDFSEFRKCAEGMLAIGLGKSFVHQETASNDQGFTIVKPQGHRRICL